MDTRKIPFLCGGVFFFLLMQAKLPNGTPREHQHYIKDEHSEPGVMADLVRTFTGGWVNESKSDTSNYKECKKEGSVNVPFNDAAICSAYGSLVTEHYQEALRRMDEFVGCHFNSEMREWFVKALIEIIEDEKDKERGDLFYIYPSGKAATRAEVSGEDKFDLSAFMVGVLHFILTRRRGQNGQGEDTLNSISVKEKRSLRRYIGHLGERINRKIDVDFLPNREAAPAAGKVEDSGRRESAENPYGESESTDCEGQRIFCVQQQTNVIQNGENNFNLTNNGTMNFNF